MSLLRFRQVAPMGTGSHVAGMVALSVLTYAALIGANALDAESEMVMQIVAVYHVTLGSILTLAVGSHLLEIISRRRASRSQRPRRRPEIHAKNDEAPAATSGEPPVKS